MAKFAEAANTGEHFPLNDEICALSAAVAAPEKVDAIETSRQALLKSSNEHVLYDVAGIIGFFAVITIVVDFAGHYSPGLAQGLWAAAGFLNKARAVRQTLCCRRRASKSKQV